MADVERFQWRPRRVRNDCPWRTRISFGLAPAYRNSDAGGNFAFEQLPWQSIKADPVRVALAPDPGRAGQLRTSLVEGALGLAPSTAEGYAVPSKSWTPAAAQSFRTSGLPGKTPQFAHPRTPCVCPPRVCIGPWCVGGCRHRHAPRCAWTGQVSGSASGWRDPKSVLSGTPPWLEPGPLRQLLESCRPDFRRGKLRSVRQHVGRFDHHSRLSRCWPGPGQKSPDRLDRPWQTESCLTCA